mmetsp:Transcript_87022/g.244014  ORF Transcript_87022/g.244014 Transcript_87022/m.244014 type:complete len:239 (+) Transcript_87022:1367-2083(+)
MTLRRYSHGGAAFTIQDAVCYDVPGVFRETVRAAQANLQSCIAIQILHVQIRHHVDEMPRGFVAATCHGVHQRGPALVVGRVDVQAEVQQTAHRDRLVFDGCKVQGIEAVQVFGGDVRARQNQGCKKLPIPIARGDVQRRHAHLIDGVDVECWDDEFFAVSLLVLENHVHEVEMARLASVHQEGVSIAVDRLRVAHGPIAGVLQQRNDAGEVPSMSCPQERRFAAVVGQLCGRQPLGE